jgi:hypothetical protein
MRNLALFLLLLNLFFLFWQLSLLSWLPWQPEQLSHIRELNLSISNDLPRLVLLGEHNISHTMDSKKNPVENLAGESVAENSFVETVASIVGQNSITSSVSPTKTHTEPQIKTGINIANIDTPVKVEITPPPLTTGSQTTIKQSANDSNSAQEVVVGSHEKNTAAKLQQISGLPMPILNKPLSQEKLKDKKINIASTRPLLKSEKLSKIEENKPSKLEACFQMGPYPRMNITKKIVKWLSIRIVLVNLKNRQTKKLKATWVYLPPFKNRQAAISSRQRLNERGIDDHAIVTTGPFNNAISLGLYHKPFYAKQRFEKLVASGYKNVKTQKRYKKYTKYWLNVKMPSRLQNTFKKKFKGRMLEPIACELISLSQ